MIRKLMNRLKKETTIVYDTETDGLNSFGEDRIVGFSFFFPHSKDKFACYIPIENIYQKY